MPFRVIQKVLYCPGKTVDVFHVHQQPRMVKIDHLGQCTHSTSYDGYAHRLTLHENVGPVVNSRTSHQHITTRQIVFRRHNTQEVNVLQSLQNNTVAQLFLQRSTTGDNEFDILPLAELCRPLRMVLHETQARTVLSSLARIPLAAAGAARGQFHSVLLK
jgi:hypothetical protein